MIRMWLAFLVVVGLTHFGIQAFRSATMRERWTVIKSLTYAFVVAIIAVLVLSIVVILF